ncbi:hypothetical protein PHMEG_00023182, partial [Phytophthora megakarya]
MAITNALIVFQKGQKQRGEPPVDHATFLTVLQDELLQVTADSGGHAQAPPTLVQSLLYPQAQVRGASRYE